MHIADVCVIVYLLLDVKVGSSVGHICREAIFVFKGKERSESDKKIGVNWGDSFLAEKLPVTVWEGTGILQMFKCTCR